MDFGQLLRKFSDIIYSCESHIIFHNNLTEVLRQIKIISNHCSKIINIIKELSKIDRNNRKEIDKKLKKMNENLLEIQTKEREILLGQQQISKNQFLTVIKLINEIEKLKNVINSKKDANYLIRIDSQISIINDENNIIIEYFKEYSKILPTIEEIKKICEKAFNQLKDKYYLGDATKEKNQYYDLLKTPINSIIQYIYKTQFLKLSYKEIIN